VCECVSIHSVRAVKQSHWTVKAAHFIVEGILTEYFNIESMYICTYVGVVPLWQAF